jgi:hypothetical protein
MHAHALDAYVCARARAHSINIACKLMQLRNCMIIMIMIMIMIIMISSKRRDRDRRRAVRRWPNPRRPAARLHPTQTPRRW